MKKFITLLTIAALLLTVFTGVGTTQVQAASSGYVVKVKGKTVNLGKDRVKNIGGKLYLPAINISKALGLKYSFKNKTFTSKTVDKKTLTAKIGKDFVTISGKSVSLNGGFVQSVAGKPYLPWSTFKNLKATVDFFRLNKTFVIYPMYYKTRIVEATINFDKIDYKKSFVKKKIWCEEYLYKRVINSGVKITGVTFSDTRSDKLWYSDIYDLSINVVNDGFIYSNRQKLKAVLKSIYPSFYNKVYKDFMKVAREEVWDYRYDPFEICSGTINNYDNRYTTILNYSKRNPNLIGVDIEIHKDNFKMNYTPADMSLDQSNTEFGKKSLRCDEFIKKYQLNKE